MNVEIGMLPRSSLSGNIFFLFSVQCMESSREAVSLRDMIWRACLALEAEALLQEALGDDAELLPVHQRLPENSHTP